VSRKEGAQKALDHLQALVDEGCDGTSMGDAAELVTALDLSAKAGDKVWTAPAGVGFRKLVDSLKSQMEIQCKKRDPLVVLQAFANVAFGLAHRINGANDQRDCICENCRTAARV